MTELLLRYQDGLGNISERLVSDIAAEGGDSITGFCHLRQQNRTFKVNRIRLAVDPSTGEVIDDVFLFLGVRPATATGFVPPRPSALKPPIPTGEDLRRLRTREKAELWRPFRFAVVAAIYKDKLFALFDRQCFKCRSPRPLVIDHHVPMTLGGHLVPGNLVALCRPCNNWKHERPPAAFYSPQELERLAPILVQEHALFDFTFDWDFWNRDRQGYLLHLGGDSALVHEVLNNPEHRLYIPPPESVDGFGITLTVDLDDLLQSIPTEPDQVSDYAQDTLTP